MDDKKPIMKSHESIHIVGFIDTHQIPYPPDEWYERLGSEGSPVSPSFAADEVSCSFIFLLLDPVKPPFFLGETGGNIDELSIG